MEHVFIAALAQAGIAIAQIVVNQGNAPITALRQPRHRPLRRIDVVYADAGDTAGIGILGALHPRRIADHHRQFR